MGASKGRRQASGGEGPRGRTMATAQREEDQRVFLATYAACGSFTRAAQALRAAQGKPDDTHCRDIHYRWLREDPTYLGRFKEARAQFADVVEEELIRRAMEGDDDVIVSAGKLVYVDNDSAKGPLLRRVRSDRLLEILVKAHLPERFGERQRLEHSGPAGGPIQSEVKADVSPEFVAAVLGHLRDAGHADPAGDPGEPLDSAGPAEAE